LVARAFAYSTENPAKVERALLGVVGPGKENATVRRAEGHFGDSIHIIELRILDPRRAEVVLRRIIDSLGLDAVLQGLEAYSDRRGCIHIRLDKQAAHSGRIVLGGPDPIKLEFTYDGDGSELRRSAGAAN